MYRFFKLNCKDVHKWSNVVLYNMNARARTYSVYVWDSTVWKVVVDDEIHSLEVDAPSHQLRADENPDLPRTETLDHIVTLKYNNIHAHEFIFTKTIQDKRAQRALGRSPEEKVKGHSGANNREPQGHNLNNFGRGPLDDAIYQIWKLWAL